MPANLTPQYLEVEEKFRKSKEPKEQLELLQEMLRIIPKHKGTERLQGEIKHKIAEIKKELSSPQSKKKGPSFHIDKGKYQQVVVIGPPNSGKSQLLSTLSGVDLKVDSYPFTTRIPQPVMMTYEEIKIQLVDTPPITSTFIEPWLTGIIRGGDIALVVVDSSATDLLEGLEDALNVLEKQKLYLSTSGEWEKELFTSTNKKTILVTNKMDIPQAQENIQIISDLYKERFKIIPVSSTTGQGLDTLKSDIFQLLKVIRVYPKPPGKKPDYNDPIVIPEGSTIIEFANAIHHSLAETLKAARIWDSKDYPPGARVPRDYVLQDKNVIEIEN